MSKLEKCIESDETFSNRHQETNRPIPEIIDQKEEYEVEAIREDRMKKWRGELHKQYLVKWKGYPEFENTWEWWDSLSKAKRIIDAYERNPRTRKEKSD